MEDIVQAILRRPGVILLVVPRLVGPTLVFSLLQPTLYEASARGVIEVDHGSGGAGTPGAMLIPPAVEIPLEAPREAIDKPAIAREAIERLGAPLDGSMEPAELLENLTVEREEATTFFDCPTATPIRKEPRG